MSAAAVNERIRVREGVDGTIVVVGAWCRTCRQESSANERGECLFCGRVIVDEDRLSSKELRTMLDLQALGFDGLAAGVHIVVPEEPHEPARKLLETLGATYEVMDEQAGFERPAPGRHLTKDSSGQALTRPVSEETTAAPDEQEPTALTQPSAPPLHETPPGFPLPIRRCPPRGFGQ